MESNAAGRRLGDEALPVPALDAMKLPSDDLHAPEAFSVRRDDRHALAACSVVRSLDAEAPCVAIAGAQNDSGIQTIKA